MENYGWVKDYCLGKTGVHEKFKEEWGATLYMLDDKYFIMVGHDKAGREIMTFKLREETNLVLRERYPSMIVPGYYCNKKLWSSVYLDQDPSAELVKELVDESYEVLLGGFSKKKQAEILD